MINRQKHINSISSLLVQLAHLVDLHNKIDLFDINKHAEPFYRELLNRVYGWDLKSLNTSKNRNQAAIDLGDLKSGIAVQVTSSSRRDKVQKTLEKFHSHKLYKKYSALKIVVITNKSEFKKKFESLQIEFNKEHDILDISDILREIGQLADVDQIAEIDGFLKKELVRLSSIEDAPSKKEQAIEPDFGRIHLGNQFLPPFVVLTLNFSLPLVNKSDSMVKDWAIHIRAPHMGVESTDKNFNKTVPADNEVLLHANKPVFPNQKTSLWFTLTVRVNYELEAENKFRKLVFNPIGLGIAESLPITLTVYCENSKPQSYEYIVHSKVYLDRLNDYYKRKQERNAQRASVAQNAKPTLSKEQIDATVSLLQHINQKETVASYLIGEGTEDAHQEISLLFNDVAKKVVELSKQAPSLDVEVGGNMYHLVARRKAYGACTIEIQWQQTYRNRFDDAQLMVTLWKGLRRIPGRSEIIFESPLSGPAQQMSFQVWRLKCLKPKSWTWEGGSKGSSISSMELVNHLYSAFTELIKAHHQAA